MAASVALTGISAGDPRPGNFLQINFAMGPASGSSGPLPILLIGNMLSGGDATAGTLYGPTTDVPAQTESDVVARTGPGSELHRMWRFVTRRNTTSPVWLCPVAPSAGAAASLGVTLTGTAATAGTLRVFVGLASTDVAVATGDTPTIQAASVVAAVNAMTELGVTATAAAGVITFTAKQTGLRGNDIRVAILPLSASMGVTSSSGAMTNLAGGATEDDFTAALAAIAAKTFYYIVSASNTTGLTALLNQVNTQALPTTGIRQRVFAGAVHTPAAAITTATGANNARHDMAHLQDADCTPAELASALAAIVALEENATVPRHNFSGYGNDAASAAIWNLPAPKNGTALSPATALSLLNNGVTPIGVTATGGTYIVKLITTRSLDGATPDYRIRDHHRVTEVDFFANDLLAKLGQQFAGCDLGDNLLPGDLPPDNPRWTCPQFIWNAASSLVDVYAGTGRMKNPAAIKAGLIVQRSTANANAVEIRIPLQNIDILDKTLTALDQVA